TPCLPFTIRDAPAGVTFTATNGVIQRISFEKPARVETRRGARIGTPVGDSADSLQKLYGANLSVEDGVWVYRANDPSLRPFRIVFRTAPGAPDKVSDFWIELTEVPNGAPCQQPAAASS